MLVSLHRFLFARAPVVEERGWGVLPSDVLHRVLDVVLRTKRWKRDGPALRLLNAHWSENVNQRITTVRPHPSRVLSRQDISSLLKFRRLTTLDVTPFLMGLQRRPSATQPTTAAHVQKLVSVLRHLPHLSHLEIETTRVAMWDRGFIYEDSRPWKRLQSITTLYLYTGTNLKARGNDPLELSSDPDLQDEEPVVDLDLGPFFRQFFNLKHVDIFLPSHWSLDDFEFLEEPFSVHFYGLNSIDLIEYFPEPQCIRSAAIENPDACEMAILEQLPELRSLKLRAKGSEPNDDCALSRMQALKCVDMDSVNWLRGDLQSTPLRNLERVTLRNTCVDLVELISNLKQLRDLSLVDCMLTSALPDFANEIQTLCIDGLRQPDGAGVQVDLSSAFCGQLTSLTLRGASDETIQSVRHLSKLEALSLAVPNRECSEIAFDAVAHLPHLRALTLWSKTGAYLFPKSFPTESLTHLETLKLHCFHWTKEAAIALQEDMGKKAPWLLLECIVMDCDPFCVGKRRYG